MFWVGDGYNLAADVHIDVVGQTSDGLLVNILVGPGANDVIFQNGFDQ